MPEGWRWERLGELAEFINGAAFKPADWHGEGTPIIRIQNLTNPEKAPNLTRRVLPAKYVVEAGDILLSWSATLDVFEWRGRTAWLNQHIFKIASIRDDIDKRYFRFLLKNEIEALKRSEHLHGSTMMHINRGPFMAHPVPVPPLSMQKSIAARIDALFAEIDEGEAALAEARAGVETYRKALLKAAVTGELTADWRAANPPQETGEQLLARILTDRRARWHADPKNARKKYTEPAGPDTNGLPELPEGWAWASVQQLSTLVTSGSRGWSEFYADSGSLFIRAANLNQDRLDLSEVAFVQVPNNSEGARTKVVQGDFLITITGANVTKCGVVTEPLDDAYVSQHVGLVRPVTAEIGQYLYLWSRAYGGGKQYLEEAAYGAGKPGLNLPNIYEMAVALPSPAEMVEIEQRVQHALDRVPEADFVGPLGGQLRQSILAAAFRGELVA